MRKKSLVTRPPARAPAGSNPRRAGTWLICALIGLGIPAHSMAQPEYGRENTDWNGLSELFALAAENHVDLTTPADLDLGSLEPNDAILVLFPGTTLPLGLGGFMAEGGRVAIADDYGAAGDFLASFGIARQPASAVGLRGNPNLPIATPHGSHPITHGVSALVTNHPTTLRHPELSPVFSVGNPPEAVVLAGAVGSGRLVVLGDPSVLINNMMQFRGNRRFAANLLSYITSSGGSGKVYLVLPTATLHGRFGTLNADRPLERARLALERATSVELPDTMVRMLAGAVAAILLLFAASALPRTSPYQRSVFVLGTEGDSRRLADRLNPRAAQANTVADALTYRTEWLLELRRRLRLHPDTRSDQVLRALEQAGLPPKTTATAAAVLRRLDGLHLRSGRPGRRPHLSQAGLASVVEQGESLLRALPDPSTSPGSVDPSTPELTG